MGALELKMIKAFSELDGLKAIPVGPAGENDGISYYAVETKNTHKPSSFLLEYNPIKNSALTFKAMIDYCVTINHQQEFVFINSASDYSASYFSNKEDIPRSIIECILKSKGINYEL